ncbi:hypothetical protein Hanom_Chr02g00117611 [Helianthus anomalus]
MSFDSFPCVVRVFRIVSVLFVDLFYDFWLKYHTWWICLICRSPILN